MVLIVDDHADIANAFVVALHLEDIPARAVYSAEEARRQVAIRTPAMIVLDDFMPGMDGLELLAELRAGNDCQIIPITFHTADDDDRRRQQALKHGISGWFIKGRCNWEDIIAHIKAEVGKAAD